MDNPALSSGRLNRTLQSRHPDSRHADLRPGHEPEVRIEHRQALIYTLAKAAELEHLIICQYLFASFSLKRQASEGLAEEHVPMVRGWARTLSQIAEQEMLHLALVQNLLTAVGAAPHLARPNFPVPPRAFPARIQIALLPFGEAALRHFVFLERPEEPIDRPIEDAEMFAALEQAQPLEDVSEDQIGPITADFATISHLYRSIEDGLERLAERMGEERLFIGPVHAQATGKDFRFPELIEVTNLETAKAAIETIVEQGEGARGEWRESHFGRLLGILQEFLAARESDPSFNPTRPVLAAYVRPVESGVSVPLVIARFTVRAMDLLNASYEVALQTLARYFNQTDESDEELSTLALVAVLLMEDVISPLGELCARLPIGPEYPGMTAGATFELFYDADWLLPHKDAAWQVIGERLAELAAFAVACRNECPPSYMGELAAVADKLQDLAGRFTKA